MKTSYKVLFFIIVSCLIVSPSNAQSIVGYVTSKEKIDDSLDTTNNYGYDQNNISGPNYLPEEVKNLNKDKKEEIVEARKPVYKKKVIKKRTKHTKHTAKKSTNKHKSVAKSLDKETQNSLKTQPSLGTNGFKHSLVVKKQEPKNTDSVKKVEEELNKKYSESSQNKSAVNQVNSPVSNVNKSESNVEQQADTQKNVSPASKEDDLLTYNDSMDNQSVNNDSPLDNMPSPDKSSMKEQSSPSISNFKFIPPKRLTNEDSEKNDDAEVEANSKKEDYSKYYGVDISKSDNNSQQNNTTDNKENNSSTEIKNNKQPLDLSIHSNAKNSNDVSSVDTQSQDNIKDETSMSNNQDNTDTQQDQSTNQDTIDDGDKTSKNEEFLSQPEERIKNYKEELQTLDNTDNQDVDKMNPPEDLKKAIQDRNSDNKLTSNSEHNADNADKANTKNKNAVPNQSIDGAPIDKTQQNIKDVLSFQVDQDDNENQEKNPNLESLMTANKKSTSEAIGNYKFSNKSSEEISNDALEDVKKK